MRRYVLLAPWERRVYKPAQRREKTSEIAKAGWVEGLFFLRDNSDKIDWHDVLDIAIEHEHRKLMGSVPAMIDYLHRVAFQASATGKNKSLIQARRLRNYPPQLNICMNRAAYGGHAHTLTLLRRWVHPRDYGKFVIGLRDFYYLAINTEKTKVMKLVSRWLDSIDTAYKIDYGEALRIAARNGTRKILRLVVPHCTRDHINRVLEELNILDDYHTVMFLRKALKKTKS